MKILLILLCAFFVSCSSFETQSESRKPQQVVGDIGGSKDFQPAAVINQYKAIQCDMSFDVKVGARLHQQVTCLEPEDLNRNSGQCGSKLIQNYFMLVDEVVGKTCLSEVGTHTSLNTASSNNPYKRYTGVAATLYVHGHASQANVAVRIGEVRSLPASDNGARSTPNVGTGLVKEINFNPAQKMRQSISVNFKLKNTAVKKIHINCRPLSNTNGTEYFIFSHNDEPESFSIKKANQISECDRVSQQLKTAQEELQIWHQNSGN